MSYLECVLYIILIEETNMAIVTLLFAVEYVKQRSRRFNITSVDKNVISIISFAYRYLTLTSSGLS